MELVKREIMDMREKMGGDSSTSTASSISVASSSSASVGKNQTMVGFDDILLEVLDKLTSHESSRQIISISGMGGIGKTTLARNIYKHDFVVQHFDLLEWLTISQVCNIANILRKVLTENGENVTFVDENDLGYKLHQMLSGRRYLIIIDDIWNIEVWDQLKLFLPDNNNGSRIIITTRLSNLARQIDESHNIVMDFMDEDNSRKLFCKHVFGKEVCPLELKEIGMNIVRGCKGLPLSISVVGGLLAKSDRQQYWEHIAENLNSIVNLEDNEHCLQILYLSYTSLPVHLKPCFLSMGYFDEDDDIFIFYVIAMWIGEEFVRPIYGKSLEEAAKEYLAELIDRNLLLIIEEKFETNLMFKSCKVHDLLRDLCLRECEKQKFLKFVEDRSLSISNNIRRISTIPKTTELLRNLLPILESASLVRFLNPSSISRFWNLQTLIIGKNEMVTPFEIWNMPQLRVIAMERLCLSDPPSGGIIMENLHTLTKLHNFKCSEEVVFQYISNLCGR